MTGKKQIIEALPDLTELEMILIWRDVRRAADVVAISGDYMRQWDEYIDLEHKIEAECERRFGEKPKDYLNRERSEELSQIYKKIFCRKKAR